MAKLSGARVIASVGSDAQGARAVRAGADHLVRHRSPDMATQIEAAAGSPVEHVVEVEYGANVDAVASVIAPNGTIATYGSAAVPQPEVPFYSLLFKAVTVRHVLVYILREAERHAAATDINAWLADGRLVPEIAHGLPLDEIAQAHEIVEKGGRAGSVVLTL
jgi:NADPH2:quinone reductase